MPLPSHPLFYSVSEYEIQASEDIRRYLAKELGGNADNYKKAFEFYKKSCDSKNFAGCHRLGNLYNNGKGVEKDYKMAANSHEKACNGGIIGSCYNLGIMYYNGVGVDLPSVIKGGKEHCISSTVVCDIVRWIPTES